MSPASCWSRLPWSPPLSHTPPAFMGHTRRWSLQRPPETQGHWEALVRAQDESLPSRIVPALKDLGPLIFVYAEKVEDLQPRPSFQSRVARQDTAETPSEEKPSFRRQVADIRAQRKLA